MSQDLASGIKALPASSACGLTRSVGLLIGYGPVQKDMCGSRLLSWALLEAVEVGAIYIRVRASPHIKQASACRKRCRVYGGAGRGSPDGSANDACVFDNHLLLDYLYSGLLFPKLAPRVSL